MDINTTWAKKKTNREDATPSSRIKRHGLVPMQTVSK